MNPECSVRGHDIQAVATDALDRFHGVSCKRLGCWWTEMRIGPPPPGTHRHRWELSAVVLTGNQVWPHRRRLVWRCDCGQVRTEARIGPSHRKEPTVVVHDRNCGCVCGE